MKVSASLIVGNTDEYRVGFETIETGFLPEDAFEYLKEEKIEIVEVLLERVKGSTSTNIAVLSEISNIISRFFTDNKSVILYFFCDDLNEIPCSGKEIEPQAYRSRLFSAMYNRFTTNHHTQDIENISICIDALGRNQYLHFIVRNHHLKYVEFIQRNIEEVYLK